MSKKRRNLLSDLFDQARHIVESAFGRGRKEVDPPEHASEPAAPEPIEEAEDDFDDYDESEEEVEEEDLEEADDLQADDFEEYLSRWQDEIEDEERTIEVRTFDEFIDAGGDAKRLRKIRYLTQQEAQDFLESAGLSAFTEILYDDQSDTFGIAVYDSPGATKR